MLQLKIGIAQMAVSDLLSIILYILISWKFFLTLFLVVIDMNNLTIKWESGSDLIL